GGEPTPRHRGDLVAGHADGARARHVEPAQQVQERRLARAARAHEGDELARAHVQVEPLEHVDLLAPAHVALVEPAHADERAAAAEPVDSNHGRPPLSKQAYARWPKAVP